MRSVLFVEHNEQIIQGYRRLLRVFSASWDLRFTADAAEAVARAVSGQADVVVADGKMVGLDGFLLELRARAPGVARVVLAGAEVKPELAVTLAVLAHQVIRKPFIPPQLYDLVERTCEVAESLANPRLKVVLGQLGSLPVMPATYSALVALGQDPNATLDRMAAVVEGDPAVSGAVLRIVNSAYFGLPRRVASVREAVRYLGIQPLKNIVLTVELYEGLAGGKAVPGMQQAALARGCAMRELLGRTPLSEPAFAAGVLADVGELLLLTRLPVDAAAIRRAVDGGAAPWDAEQERLGCTHAELGAAMLARWNLPTMLVEAVALHHVLPGAGAAPTVGTALGLVTALEFEGRHGRVRPDEVSEKLVQLFPTASVDLVRRYFHGPAVEAG